MTDTARPLNAILALLPDNTAGDITPQDVRDWAASIQDLRTYVPLFNFAALPASLLGGNLVGGNQATITFTTANPCPWGMNGSDTNHYIYISGGTGTAEARLITGGTAVAGGTSGTITFTPLNNHTGAYTVTSASSGLAEQITQYPTLLSQLPTGTINLYATVTPPNTWPGMVGQGFFNSILGANFTGATVIAASSTYMTFKDFLILPLAGNMTTGSLINCSATALVQMHRVYLGGQGGTAAAYGGLTMAGGNLIASGCYIVAEFRCIALTDTSFEISHTYAVGNRVAGTVIAVSAALYLAGAITTGGLYGFWHPAGAFAYGILVATTASVAEINIAGLYLDNWTVAGISVSGTTAGANHSWALSSFRIVDNLAAGTACVILAASASGWTFSSGFIVYINGYGVFITGSATDLQFSGVEIEPGGIAAPGAVVATVGTPARITLSGCQLGIGQTASGTSALGFFSSVAIDYLTIVGCTINAVTQAAKITLAGTETHVRISGNNGIGNVRKTAASAATFTFPLMEDDDVLEITGTTDLTTVAGLREGQKGMIVCTDAGSLANLITQGNNIGSPTYTPVRYQPFHFFFSNSVFYAGNS